VKCFKFTERRQFISQVSKLLFFQNEHNHDQPKICKRLHKNYLQKSITRTKHPLKNILQLLFLPPRVYSNRTTVHSNTDSLFTSFIEHKIFCVIDYN
jgi:hypothetical protein